MDILRSLYYAEYVTISFSFGAQFQNILFKIGTLCSLRKSKKNGTMAHLSTIKCNLMYVDRYINGFILRNQQLLSSNRKSYSSEPLVKNHTRRIDFIDDFVNVYDC